MVLVALLASPAAAVDPYDDSQSNPLRLVAYGVAPAGYLIEWLVVRPLHRLVSQNDLEPVFSHGPHTGYDYETYYEGLATGVTFETPRVEEGPYDMR